MVLETEYQSLPEIMTARNTGIFFRVFYRVVEDSVGLSPVKCVAEFFIKYWLLKLLLIGINKLQKLVNVPFIIFGNMLQSNIGVS